MLAATTREVSDKGCLAGLDHGLLARPLEFILADHLRQRDLCRLLERLASEAELDLALADAVAEHLASDMAIHVLDEEEDLFPLLRRRATAGDDIERVLGLLSREHARDDRLADTIIAGLRLAVVVRAKAVDDDLKAALREFAYRQRRHLAVENAIVMPLAEARLTPVDLEGLARRMAVRRGISLRSGPRHD
jgi:hemerythrin-like domain-containing protein